MGDEDRFISSNTSKSRKNKSSDEDRFKSSNTSKTSKNKSLDEDRFKTSNSSKTSKNKLSDEDEYKSRSASKTSHKSNDTPKINQHSKAGKDRGRNESEQIRSSLHSVEGNQTQQRYVREVDRRHRDS